MLESIINQVTVAYPMSESAMRAVLAGSDQAYKERSAYYLGLLQRYLDAEGVDISEAIDSFVHLNKEIIRETFYFKKHGCYRCKNQSEAFDDTYNNPQVMRSYVLGIALSQFLWQNHYRMFEYFHDSITEFADKVDRYLEIGPGHGFFFVAANRIAKPSKAVGVDISETSLGITKGMIRHAELDPNAIELRLQNAMDIDASQESYDFISMGEVIEHLDDPRPVLKTIAGLLAPEGRSFLTTCTNCPARDHVYLFKRVAEIRALLAECGLEIIHDREFVQPGDERLSADQALINYAAIVGRKG